MCDHCSDILTDLLPGKVTTVLKRKKVLNPNLNPDTSLVGVRIPDHQFVREVVRRCGQPIALTSANASNSRSTLDVEASQMIYFMHVPYRTLAKESPLWNIGQSPILGIIS